MRAAGWMVGGVVTGSLACAGAGPTGATGGAQAAPVVFRIDYSNVDGGSCMSGGGTPSLAWREDWDQSNCPTRATRGDRELSLACIAAINAECCTQIGATVVGWQGHTMGSEKLLSPLCKLPPGGG